MQKKEFYISERTSEGVKWTKVLAAPFKKYGVDMFIRCVDGIFSISLVNSGVKICEGKTKIECVNKLDKIVERNGREAFLEKVEDFTYKIYKKAGTNPKEYYTRIKAGIEKFNESSELLKLDTENGHDLIVTHKVKYETPKELLNFLKGLYPNFFGE